MYHKVHTEARGWEGFGRERGEVRDVAGVPAPDADRGVYGITTAAELVGMGVQNLRLYEARGLLEPDRTDGGTRRYSAHDLNRLRRIGDLLDAGLNLAGIGMVLCLETENAQLRAERDDEGGLPTVRPSPTRKPAPHSASKAANPERRR
jgi:DNA-binding transcriptional MerR regulator